MVSDSPVVLITGANQGIGFSISELLSQSKMSYTILVGARNASKGIDAVSQLNTIKINPNAKIVPFLVDLNSHESIVSAVDKVSTDYGRLDILINNAAIGSANGGQQTSDRTEWQKVFETNVFGTVDLTHAFLPLLQKSPDPKIVVVTSTFGTIAATEAADPLFVEASPYKASKAAINMVLVEWNKLLKGIKVWGVCPGLCATDLAGEFTRKNGQDPRKGAVVVQQCIEGERENLRGKMVFEQDGEWGTRPW
ncbi:NAD(P)-binding protein [Lojkania enalia]|uniref:NAD(P)-binding protein n=1 Tax=Lojkania enalia TaxID=147567 RepID=A0A9P4K3E1_9PLEO|nr:NAD(P)-binding protein [Didymosphaeria enalia]